MKKIIDIHLSGYIEDEIQDDHYLSGSIKKEILQPDRDWTSFLPKDEVQRKRKIETSNCTAFGTLNAEEIYLKRKYGITMNGSDRYLGICAGTTINGNSPHKVAEVQRNYAGIVPENVCSFNNSIKTADDYYRGLVWGHKLLGVKWLWGWEIQHEWVLNGSETNWQEQLYDALQYGPLGIAVDAWRKEGNRYVRRRNTDNHWTSLVGAKKGSYWLVYDSYEEHLKKLNWDYGFTRAKQYVIFPREDYPLQFFLRIGMGLIV